MMGQSAPPQAADDMKLGGADNAPGGCAAIPTDLTRLQKWANKNLIKCNKGKQNLTLEKKPTLCTRTCWRPTTWEAALQNRAWGPAGQVACDSNVPLQQRLPTAPQAV